MLGESSVPSEAVDGTADIARVPPDDGPLRRALAVLRRALTARPGSVWRDPVIWAVAAVAFGAYFVISLYKLLQLAPSSWDLGIYTEFVRQLSQFHAPIVNLREPGFNLEGDHFQILVGIIAPFFRLFPTAATLLFFQALFAALSVFPVATVASLFTGRSTSRLIAFAYAFSWGLQQMIYYEFHEIALAVPLLAFSSSALVRRRPGAAIAWAMPLVFVKEDQGFTVAAIGMLLAATSLFPRLLPVEAATQAVSRSPLPAGPGERPPAADPQDYRYVALWGGVFLAGWGLFWSMFAITVIIPHFNPLHQYDYWTNGGAVGGGKTLSVGALVQLGAGWPTKGQTLVMLLLPTAFAALGSPVALLAVPSLVLRFISTDSSFWGTGWHYNATVMPILFIAAAEAIGRWGRAPVLASSAPPPAAGRPGRFRWLPGLGSRWRGPTHLARLVHSAERGLARHGGAMMAAVALALAFQFPLSDLWHASTYQLSPHVAVADAAMAVVPDGATVTTTLDLLAPLAARTDTFWIGNAGNPATQYIVIDSGYYQNVPQLIAQWYPHDRYQQVFDRDNVYVFRRG